MLNKYPLWKNLIIVLILLVGGLYALPNLFGDDPAIQISSERGRSIDTGVLKKVESLLERKNYANNGINLENKTILARFKSTDDQLAALDDIKTELGDGFFVSQNFASKTPDWLKAVGGDSMNLGLDLRGGIHFLMEVDMSKIISNKEKDNISQFRTMLREGNIRYIAPIKARNGTTNINLKTAEDRDKASDILRKEFPRLTVAEKDEGGVFNLSTTFSEQEKRDIENQAIEQNISTLRNRVNELGVAEPTIQRQGKTRIVVQLPGVQDSNRAKAIIGATATLEFRLVYEKGDPLLAMQTGKVPPLSILRKMRDDTPVLLKKSVIVKGDRIIDAASGFDQQSNSPMVSINLDSKGARKMSLSTRDNIGKRMAVLFIDEKIRVIKEGDETKFDKTTTEEVINVAVIQDHLSKRFQITGLDSATEARDLALLIRAGSLSAPMGIIEERTVGPSLGKENIDKGMLSVIIGLVAVLVFMAIYYRVFGLVANLALVLNIVLVIALLSMLQATLTLPGIAGIVLTVGMAVDANVLIFERIREEIRNGNSPQASIYTGYEKAYSTIMDANITTLIAAVVLFSFGTGPIKGFAITLALGIITSMFTSIMGTRALINLIYGKRRVKKLSI